ncbi:hypothetical protein AB0G15_05720 [Streptosporangium sp. NPDC023825]|uniref:hypothetical protein n=1 Tax=Streptosporangium sp. NPDC023825 TaxID=3154909 RepID=UPI00342D34ED
MPEIKTLQSPIPWAMNRAFAEINDEPYLTANERLVLLAVAYLADLDMRCGMPIAPAPIYLLRPATGLEDWDLKNAITDLERKGVLIPVDNGRVLPDEAYE